MQLLSLNDDQIDDEKWDYTAFGDGRENYDKGIKETFASKKLACRDHINEASEAVKGAKQTRLPDKMTMTTILDSYPVGITRMIAHKWGLDSHGSKKKVIRSITGVMYAMIPEILRAAHRIETDALCFIAKHPYLPVKMIRGPLNKFLARLKSDDRIFDAFVSEYVRAGILTVGRKNINGEDLTVLTMASDVRRMVLSYYKLINLRAQNKGILRDVGHLEQQTTSSHSTATITTAQKKKKKKKKKERENKVSGSVTAKVKNKMRGQKKKSMSSLEVDSSMHNLIKVPLGTPLTKYGRPTSIFKGDMIDIKAGDVIDNIFEVMVMYALDKYKEEFEKVRGNCPYLIRGNDVLQKFKQQMTWFLMDRKNPATGITIVEEFVKEKIDDPETAYNLIRTSELFFDIFTVIEHSNGDIIARGTKTRKTYRIWSNLGPSRYPVGCIFEGRIHPHYDKYKMCGITYIIQM